MHNIQQLFVKLDSVDSLVDRGTVRPWGHSGVSVRTTLRLNSDTFEAQHLQEWPQCLGKHRETRPNSGAATASLLLVQSVFKVLFLFCACGATKWILHYVHLSTAGARVSEQGSNEVAAVSLAQLGTSSVEFLLTCNGSHLRKGHWLLRKLLQNWHLWVQRDSPLAEYTQSYSPEVHKWLSQKERKSCNLVAKTSTFRKVPRIAIYLPEVESPETSARKNCLLMYSSRAMEISSVVVYAENREMWHTGKKEEEEKNVLIRWSSHQFFHNMLNLKHHFILQSSVSRTAWSIKASACMCL